MFNLHPPTLADLMWLPGLILGFTVHELAHALVAYQATRRVRQSSLDAVLDALKDWNIEYLFPSGFVGADEYITLSRGQASRQPKQSASVQPFDVTQERREGFDKPRRGKMTPKTIISKLGPLTTLTMQAALTGTSASWENHRIYLVHDQEVVLY
jgi:hypothetical protein